MVVLGEKFGGEMDIGFGYFFLDGDIFVFWKVVGVCTTDIDRESFIFVECGEFILACREGDTLFVVGFGKEFVVTEAVETEVTFFIWEYVFFVIFLSIGVVDLFEIVFSEMDILVFFFKELN